MACVITATRMFQNCLRLLVEEPPLIFNYGAGPEEVFTRWDADVKIVLQSEFMPRKLCCASRNLPSCTPHFLPALLRYCRGTMQGTSHASTYSNAGELVWVG